MARDIAEATPLVAQTVDRFLADRCRPADWVRVAASQHGWSRDNWREMAELGWLGICLPESAGGLGCGIEERIAVMEGVGRGLVLEPYMSTAVLCAELVQAAGGQAQHPALLPAIAAGEQVMAFAATEPGARFETLPIACTAVRESGGGWRLDGQKIAVLDAPGAATLVVLARTAGAACDRSGLSLFLVEPTAAGIILRVPCHHRHLCRSRRRHGRGDRHDHHPSQGTPAVRQAAGQLPGTAPPRGRHAHCLRAGAIAHHLGRRIAGF
jgi:alkylation response protein AidB-like acyl-CoA dehydrogenase